MVIVMKGIITMPQKEKIKVYIGVGVLITIILLAGYVEVSGLI